MTDLTNPIFTDAEKARKHLETLYWPLGPVCRHCGNADPKRITKLAGKSTRPGVHWCNECDKPFSVTVGTVMEDSKIPLNKWVLAFHLMAASKKGMSAHQLHRMLGVTYKTAWFLCHRIREAMGDTAAPSSSPLGGEGKIVEVDETYVGGKAKNRAHGAPSPKKAVVSLIERDGRARSFHVASVTAKTVRSLIVTHVNRKSTLMSDEANFYSRVGAEFAAHHAVDHTRKEYAYADLPTGHTVSINVSENFYSILKRGITGTYHSISEAHLHRYLKEFDFRYNNRSKAVLGAEGKRLTYNQPTV